MNIKKKLMYSDGQNNYYVINPRLLTIILVILVLLLSVLVATMVTLFYFFSWVDSLDMVSRLFAVVEGTLI